ncbi:hypothetical protein SAMN05880501_104177 [Ureibacillus xyleni]|uniref:Uncharacterized protein n=1 Tax=Ureibacillus xyleni TaxID=614648 RepID=A0A285SDW4_9BACL|nr:hypothetical protein [Ureibacillus xyleni]SOC06069.1 hypothetical protein SAMN05880501_104177 [Ureibacillus xyleni]
MPDIWLLPNETDRYQKVKVYWDKKKRLDDANFKGKFRSSTIY